MTRAKSSFHMVRGSLSEFFKLGMLYSILRSRKLVLFLRKKKVLFEFGRKKLGKDYFPVKIRIRAIRGVDPGFLE